MPVEPNAFDITPHVAITDALNRKYANKLIANKGLALSVYDITTAEDGKVTWGNGLMYYKGECIYPCIPGDCSPQSSSG